MSAVLDLSEAFLALWPGFVQRPGLKRLVAYALGLRLNKSKSVQTSNWDARPLSAHQIRCDSPATYDDRVVQAERRAPQKNDDT